MTAIRPLRSASLLGLVASASFMIVGCKPGLMPVVQAVAPKTIPLKVWVVLSQGGPLPHPDPGIELEDTPYDQRSNRGCRYTKSEIRERVSLLQLHASIFGWTFFSWDGNLEDDPHAENNIVVPWVRLASPPDWPRYHHVNELYADILLAVPGAYHDPDAINIYFVGFVAHSEQEVLHAITKPPQSSGIPPCIIINDDGLVLPNGFWPGMNPDETLSWHVLEHELCHFLNRFPGNCYPRPDGPRCYGATDGHIGNAYNLMRNEPPCPLYIPGEFDDVNTEKGEIWTRIRFNHWNEN